jgi:hypothetical protein
MYVCTQYACLYVSMQYACMYARISRQFWGSCLACFINLINTQLLAFKNNTDFFIFFAVFISTDALATENARKFALGALKLIET